MNAIIHKRTLNFLHTLMRDYETIFKVAKKQKKFTVALRAKKLAADVGKQIFEYEQATPQWDSLSTDELEALISIAQKNLKDSNLT